MSRRRAAKRTATQWTGRTAVQSIRASGVPLWVPDHLVHLGDVDRIDYVAEKQIDADGNPVQAIWEHIFPKRAPLLADAETGTMIILGHGSRYSLTVAGIDDWPPNHELIIPLSAPVQIIEDHEDR